MISRIIFAALSVFALSLLLFSAEAEKSPLWEWESDYAVNHVAISDDSRNISAAYASSISLWYNDTLNPRNTKTVGSGISSMVMSTDGKYVLIGEEYDTTVTLYEDGGKLWETNDFLNTVRDIDISSDGSYIAVVDFRNVHLFHKSSSDKIWINNHPSEVMSAVSISPDGNYIAAGTENGKVYVYGRADNSSDWLHDDILDERIIDIEFSGNSSHFVFGTESGRVYVYETVSEDDDYVFDYNQPEEVTCVSAGPDSRYFAFGNQAGILTILDVDQGNWWDADIGGIVTSISFNGIGDYVVAGSNNNKLMLANVSTSDESWRTSTFGSVLDVAASHRGENIAVATDEGLAVYYESQLDNQAPIATINSITPTIALPGSSITMNGSASDSDGEIVAYRWHSSIDGDLSSNKIFTTSSLSMGLHVITFSAQDNEGRWSKNISADVGVGDFPEAEIVSVSDCDLSSTCLLSEGSSIIFEGSAASTVSNDTEIIGYQWHSSIDGELSSQASFTTSSLSLGTHTISFRAVNDIGFWSANATMSLLINGVPVSSIISVNPNPVQPGEDVLLMGLATDPDNDTLTYIWSSDTLLFANSQNLYESQDNGSKVVTTESDVGSHEVYLRVMDSNGVYSESSQATIEVLSPPLISAQCDTEAGLEQDLLFNAIASDKDGSIVLYEWDFDSSTGDIDSVDFSGASFATHSYNVTPDDSYYTVVVRVTDNDGLVSRDTCTVEIVEQVDTPKDAADTSSSSSSLGSLSEIASPPIIGGIVLLVLIIGGVGYYMLTRNDDTPYVPPPKSKRPVSGSSFMDSVVPEVSPVKERKVVERKVVTDLMTIECPECSSQMDVPNVSGMQHVQCSECGLEGEFEI